MAFTEFVCKSGGSNLNGGALASGAEPLTTAAYTCTNSNWDGTSVFTPTDGSTPANTVTVGDFASVYLDAATVAVFVARVVTVAAGVNGAITLSTTAKSGTEPAAGATGRTIKVGGAWKGPNAAEAFPIAFITSALTNAAGNLPRVNLKNTATYSITAAMTHANAGVRFQGYTSSFGDSGMATIDGGVAGASYVLLTLSASDCDVLDIIFQNNGASGLAAGFTVSGAENYIKRVVVNNVRGSGLNISGAFNTFVENETYACNQSNTASLGGTAMSVTANLIRCISHDNSGSNNSGFVCGSVNTLNFCIADTNGFVGFNCTSTVLVNLVNCDSYNNISDGIRMSNASAASFYFENCNLIKNGGWGINGSGAGGRNGAVINCAFGSGTSQNTLGTTTGLQSMVESGTVTYSANVTPYTAPDTGNFTLNLAAAINTGRGAFTETQASYTGTVGMPDIGAAQAQGSVISPVSTPPVNIGAKTLGGFTALGTVTVGTTPITMESAFPGIGISGKTVATVQFCTHEANSASGIIYVGDLTMTSSTQAIMTMLGPNVVEKLENMGALNTIPIGNITLLSNAAGQQVRISVLVS